jgi:hypothetical protein
MGCCSGTGSEIFKTPSPSSVQDEVSRRGMLKVIKNPKVGRKPPYIAFEDS